MKKVFTILLYLTGPVFCLAQDNNKNFGFRLPSAKVGFEGGINFSLPAHDDLMRTHTLGLGLSARAMMDLNEHWEIGLRAEYDHRFAKRDYPDSVLKFTNKHRDYTIMSLKPGVQFNFRPRYFAGLEAGMAYVKLEGDSKTGFGFVEEFDGSTPIGFMMEVYAGKKFNYVPGRMNLAMSVYWQFFFAETHGESVVGLRAAYLFNR